MELKVLEHLKREKTSAYLGAASALVTNSPLPGISSMVRHAFPNQLKGYEYIMENIERMSLYRNSDIPTALHESFHKYTFDALFKNLYMEPYVTVYNWETFKCQVNKTGDIVGSLIDLFTGKYYGLDKPRGSFTIDSYIGTPESPRIVPTSLGSFVGESVSNLFVTLAGTLGQLSVATLLYLFGRKIKNKNKFIGNLIQVFSFGEYANSIYYPINTFFENMRGEKLGGDWDIIYNACKSINIDPIYPAAVISAIYPATVIGLYLKDRRSRKIKERKEAIYRLLSDNIITKEEMEKTFQKYAVQCYSRSKLSKILPFKLPFSDDVSKLRAERRQKKLLKYNVDKFDDFDVSENHLMEKLKVKKTIIETLKLRMRIKRLRSLRNDAISDLFKDKPLRDLVDNEKELCNMLYDRYFDFEKDSDGFSKKLQEELNLNGNLEDLKNRLKLFYDTEDKSAMLTVYGKLCST